LGPPLGVKEHGLPVAAFIVGDTVVTRGAVDLVLFMNSVIDDDARRGRDLARVKVVTLGALLGGHLLRVQSKLAVRIQRELVIVRHGEYEFAEGLSLLEREGDGIRVHWFVARHAGDHVVARPIVGRDGVVLHLVTDLRAEPVSRRRAKGDYDDRGKRQEGDA